MEDKDQLKLYHQLADWWPLLDDPAVYAEEAAFYQARLLETAARPCRTLLELGSGGGNNASHLKARFSLVLVDRSRGMLAVSRALNPGCEHVEGDMRTVRLGRRFDCVFVHDAVGSMATEADLRRAIETAYVHCEPGGSALFAPDYLRDNFRPSTDCGGRDLDGRALRYLEWVWDPHPDDTSYVADYAFVLRQADGSVEVVLDRHVEGLFWRADWLRLLGDVGFEAHAVRFDHSELDPNQYEILVGKRPA
jgi:SAM-dependent methyltransferase